MPLGIKFTHTPRPRGYRHVNIYYDPEKEERQERENRVNKELGRDNEAEFRTSIKRGTFRRLHQTEGSDGTTDISRQTRQANIRFIIIAAILLVVGLLLWLI